MSLVSPLLQSDPISAVIGLHIGEDDLVPDLKPIFNLNRGDRALPESHLDANRVDSIRLDFEQPDSAVLLPHHRPSDEHNVVKPLQLDRTFYAEIRNRSLREIAGQLGVDRSRTVLNGRINTNDFSWNYSASSVNGDRLADQDILDLGFSDLQLGCQPLGIGDASLILTRL